MEGWFRLHVNKVLWKIPNESLPLVALQTNSMFNYGRDQDNVLPEAKPNCFGYLLYFQIHFKLWCTNMQSQNQKTCIQISMTNMRSSQIEKENIVELDEDDW